MNIFSLAAKRALHRPFAAALNILLVAVGVATTSLVLILSDQAKGILERDARGIDLVLAANGSPIQIVLSSVYHLDAPVGTISLSVAKQVGQHPMVRSAIATAMGDNIQGFRIIGTDVPALLGLYRAALSVGRLPAEPMEVVVGSTVARTLGLKIGDTFAGTHGLSVEGDSHGNHKYVVVGIVASQESVSDRLVFTPIESVWLSHAHDDNDSEEEVHLGEESTHVREKGATHNEDENREISSVIVTYKSPLAAIALRKELNKAGTYMAVSPVNEIARIISIAGVAIDLLYTFGALLLVFAGFAVFVGLANGAKDARYEIAMMRLISASRSKIAFLIVLEATIFAIVGIATGLAAAHSIVAIVDLLVANSSSVGLSWMTWANGESVIAAAALAVAWLGALFPAWKASRTSVHDILSDR